MRIQGGHIGGFGRLCDRPFELQSDLQVVFGPNEQGKSTLRAYLIDMLFGQRDNLLLPGDLDGTDYRKPWTNGGGYGGTIAYILDDGRSFEVERDFARGPNATRVVANGARQDASDAFPRSLGGDLLIAEHHLGLPKALYVAAATIDHASPHDFSQDSMMEIIGERLASIADTGGQSGSAANAIEALEAYTRAIGDQGSPADRPLRRVAARIAQIDDELRAARSDQRRCEDRAVELTQLREQLDAKRGEAAELQRRIEAHQHMAELGRLQEAERLTKVIADATKTCFALSAARDVPRERAAELKRLETRVLTARADVDRTRTQLNKAQSRYEEERDRLGVERESSGSLLEDTWEERIAAVEDAAREARDRLDALEREKASLNDKVDSATASLESLPDFSMLASDPMLWLNQLANTFDIHRRSRDSESERCERIRTELESYAERIEGPVEVFDRMDDVIAETQQYEVEMRVAEERRSTLQSRRAVLEPAIQEHRASVPASVAMSVVTALLAGGFGAVVWITQVPGAILPAVFSGVGAGYYLLNALYSRAAARSEQREFDRAGETLGQLEQDTNDRETKMQEWLNRAQCDGPRELAAYYESFRKDSEHYNALKARLEEQEQLLEETKTNVRKLYGQVCAAIESAGETVINEDDVAAATARAISRYQEYRDAKRRLSEGRTRARDVEGDIDEARRVCQETEKADVECSLALRRALRDAGFRDEEKHTKASAALKAYRIRAAQAESHRGRVEVLQEKLSEIQRQLEIEEQDRNQLEEELARQLGIVGVASLEEWNELIDQAHDYHEAWTRRTEAQRELGVILGGEDIEAIRDRCEGFDDAKPDGDPTALAEAYAPIREEIEALEQQERDTEVALAEQLAALSDMNAIEEERVRLSAVHDRLKSEIEAAAYAAAVIERTSARMHAGLAPALSARATEFYQRITGNSDVCIDVAPDFSVRARIPETGELREDFAQMLSRGAQDQVYFSLRLALAQALSQTGERVPLLFDDPFSNYDDDRLDRTMGLLRCVAEENQVLLFTCRTDVADAARRAGANILEL